MRETPMGTAGREGRGEGEGEVIAELAKAAKRYGPVTALHEMDFRLRAGEVVAVLGPNGAGKTTAVGLLLGLIRPTAGAARLFGLEPRRTAARVRVGAMLQISKVPETLKVREHLELVSSYYPRPLPMAAVLAAAGLAEVAERPFGKLSGGQRQRLLFALAVCGDPDLLFLDEPTVGLDVEARRGLWATIAERAASGRSVLLTTHYLEEADALADRIVLLYRGRVLAEGTPGEIKARVEGRRIRCRTRLPAAEIRGIAGVRAVRGDGGAGGEAGDEREILTGAGERVAEQVVAVLLTLDPALSGLEVAGAGLEDAFLALTAAAGAAGNVAERQEVAA